MFSWLRDNRYQELEETPAVLTPLRPTSMLQPSHFSTPLQQLRYPVRLDFAHERFRLRSLALLSQLKESALQQIDLTDNELQALTELNRFTALKSLIASRNLLCDGPGIRLSLHRLTRLDLGGNQLRELPPLGDLVLLQVPMPTVACFDCAGHGVIVSYAAGAQFEPEQDHLRVGRAAALRWTAGPRRFTQQA